MHLKSFKFPSSFSLRARARGDASLIILPPHLPSAASESFSSAISLECTFPPLFAALFTAFFRGSSSVRSIVRCSLRD